ncbi:MAG: acyl--CoA ligase [Leptospiraceae bacterium]|nr:acyl--CoA ligase [Leptospiraceae bacterium]MDW7975690.1 class I adenylate-forming enzyme family protein [Leptospiraceae bacterium]
MFFDVDIYHHSLNWMNPWRNILFDLLKYKSNPILITKETIYTADSLWTLSRLWKELLAKFSLKKGDTILLHLPKSEHLLANIINGLFQSYPLILANPKWDLWEIKKQTNPKIIITDKNNFEYFSHFMKEKQYEFIRVLNQDFVIIHLPEGNNIEEVVFFLRTSGTHSPKWIGLTNREIFFNINVHSKIFEEYSIVLSILPWFHSFGLILDLLSTFLKKSYIIIDENHGKDIEYIDFLFEKFLFRHLSMVPLTLEKLIENGYESILFHLNSGIIGGAKIPSKYLPLLKNTKLRVGYGQTEAGPGISIGEPGDWENNYVGRILCDVMISEDGEILYHGDNVYQYELKDGSIIKYDSNRWVSSGDLGFLIDDRLYYEGRKSYIFKLKNGRWFNPLLIEEQIKREYQIDHCIILNDNHVGLIVIFSNDIRTTYLIPLIEKTLLYAIRPYIKAIITIQKEEFFKTNKGDYDRLKIYKYVVGRYGLHDYRVK